MQQAGRDENGQEQVRSIAEDAELAVVRTPETQKRRRKVVGCLLQVLALQLTLFGLLAWFVHVHPILPLDVAMTRSLPQDQAPWLRITVLAISYPGSSLLLPVLILLTVGAFWAVGARLEAVFVGGLSTVSLLLNLLLKVQVGRRAWPANLVHIIQTALGYSFPSGHVMAYIAYWGLLFAFGVILFEGRLWWRTALLITSAALVVLIGPSRIYLGDPTGPAMSSVPT